MAEKNYPIEVLILIFFTPPRWVDAAFVWYRPARICAVSLQSRTRRHDAPHAAEQVAAPMCISDLCRSSTVNFPPGGGIGVRVLPASRVLVPKCYACAFLARQEKPKTQPESHAAVSYTAYNLAFLHFEFRSRYISRYAGSKFVFCFV